MQRLVTIIFKGIKIETVATHGTRNTCENQAFEYADSKLGLTSEEDKSQVELYFHEDARSQVLFSDIPIY